MGKKRTTNAHATGEEPIGEGPEIRPESAVGEDAESLRDRLKVAEQQRDDYLALLQRTRADFENYQKRIRRDLAEEQPYAIADFARELLTVRDNLQRAIVSVREEAEKSPLVQGVALVQSQLLDTFGRFGITPIDALGQPFDPSVHEAVLQQPRDDVNPGTVVDVLEPGYRLHGRVLRPAKVVLAGSDSMA
jgi:molecular chaperone GrpE